MSTETSLLRPFAALALPLLLATACAQPEATVPPPDATYSVRGEIAKMPGGASSELWIQHEAIPDFRNDKGETVGMESMTMPFPVGAGVSLEGLAPGDRVAFDFEVRWQGSGRPLAITKIERLPDGTRLGFDPAPAEETDENVTPDQAGGRIPQ